MTRFLITDNGPHSADVWAQATAEEIFQPDPSMSPERLTEAKQLQLDIAAILKPLHELVIQGERMSLAQDDDHCDSIKEVGDIAQYGADEIAQAAIASPWANVLRSDDWKAEALKVIRNHMQTAQHVERLWFADQNPENISARTYKARYGQGI